MTLVFNDKPVKIESMVIESTGPLVHRASMFAALGDPGRLALVDQLLFGDASPSELQRLSSMPSNLLAHHLKTLAKAGLVRRVRSQGDRRRVYVTLNVDALGAAMPAPHRDADRVVFVCREGSTVSPLAAAVWSKHSTLAAISAGTHPDSRLNRAALRAARRHHLKVPTETPAHIDNVVRPRDLIVAVCDDAHEELTAGLLRIHWSIPHPGDTPTAEAFDRTVESLTKRIDRLVATLRY